METKTVLNRIIKLSIDSEALGEMKNNYQKAREYVLELEQETDEAKKKYKNLKRRLREQKKEAEKNRSLIVQQENCCKIDKEECISMINCLIKDYSKDLTESKLTFEEFPIHTDCQHLFNKSFILFDFLLTAEHQHATEQRLKRASLSEQPSELKILLKQQYKSQFAKENLLEPQLVKRKNNEITNCFGKGLESKLKKDIFNRNLRNFPFLEKIKPKHSILNFQDLPKKWYFYLSPENYKNSICLGEDFQAQIAFPRAEITKEDQMLMKINLEKRLKQI